MSIWSDHSEALLITSAGMMSRTHPYLGGMFIPSGGLWVDHLLRLRNYRGTFLINRLIFIIFIFILNVLEQLEKSNE